MDELSLYDVVNTPGVAADLSHISTAAVSDNYSYFLYPNICLHFLSVTLTCIQKISGYLPKDDGLKSALTGADIVVIPAGIPRKSTHPGSIVYLA